MIESWGKGETVGNSKTNKPHCTGRRIWGYGSKIKSNLDYLSDT